MGIVKLVLLSVIPACTALKAATQIFTRAYRATLASRLILPTTRMQAAVLNAQRARTRLRQPVANLVMQGYLISPVAALLCAKIYARSA
jgi:hypothetical protein